jgi:hypothetical protein
MLLGVAHDCYTGGMTAAQIFVGFEKAFSVLARGGAPAAEVPTQIERKVYKGSAEHREYLDARFSSGANTGLSFEWDGNRWAYRHTSFDDAGDYDLLWRPAPIATAAEVPEAMGDEPALPDEVALHWLGEMTESTSKKAEKWRIDGRRFTTLYTADQLRTYAKQYAQWQSTRLRGGVPEIDYDALIRAAFAKNRKWAQGTNGCVAFAKGAEWFREQALIAAQAGGA